MKRVTLLLTLLIVSFSFSQSTKVYDMKPLPKKITQRYADESSERHKLKFVKNKRSVDIYVNSRYVFTEKTEVLKEYCKKLLEFNERNKAMVISTDDTKSVLLGRMNERIDVVSIRVEKDKKVFPMVMSVSRLESIYNGLLSIKK